MAVALLALRMSGIGRTDGASAYLQLVCTDVCRACRVNRSVRPWLCYGVPAEASAPDVARPFA
eukprot:827697-Alexandrium_andersonii.AAC.1